MKTQRLGCQNTQHRSLQLHNKVFTSPWGITKTRRLGYLNTHNSVIFSCITPCVLLSQMCSQQSLLAVCEHNTVISSCIITCVQLFEVCRYSAPRQSEHATQVHSATEQRVSTAGQTGERCGGCSTATSSTRPSAI